MCRNRKGQCRLLVGWVGVLFGLTPVWLAAGETIFTPLAMNQGNTENRTGMWLRPDLGKADEILPLKTRVQATRESVLGGAAVKIEFEKGSTGKLTYELEETSLAKGSAGLTLYAKASRKVTITICGAPAEVGTDWTKLDFPWDKVGMTPEKPAWQFVVILNGPITEPTTLLLDRIGTEGPAFDGAPKLEKQAGPDKQISSKDLTYGAENLAAVLANAKAKKPFKVFALGDSVTAGAQAGRSTFSIRGPAGVGYLYFGQLARVWQAQFGYEGIIAVQKGYGGKTAEWALNHAVEKDIVEVAGPDDVVVLEYGANEMGWDGKSAEQWKADMKKLIARVKTKTKNILVLSPTSGGEIPQKAAEITLRLKEIVAEEKVCGFDITRMSQFRGEAFGWSYLGNEYHPDFVGHLMMGDMIATVLTGEVKNWP